MQWELCDARNGEVTLKLNDIFIYSKYQPYKSTERWMSSEVNLEKSHFLLIGLGLGYHLQILKEMVKEKQITVLCFEKQEYELFKSHNMGEWWEQPNIEICYTLNPEKITRDTQVLLPNVWIKALGEQHNLFSILETIKINQQSYKKFEPLMHENFTKNISDMSVTSYPEKQHEFACLVAAGPSLDETIQWLKAIRRKVDIYAVGSALKPLLEENIIPDAVVISDAQDAVLSQFEGTNYTKKLFYISTANFKSVNAHRGPKFIIFQKGYSEAEMTANELNYPLLETGGSVSTTTFSLIEYLGYEKLVLFGQDLGFEGQSTHAEGSTSGKSVITNLRVKANDGTMINTQPNLQVYHRWFNEACQQTSMQVYNTAQKGAAITNVPLITEEQFKGL